MLQLLLTLMLCIMPFLISQKTPSRPGLHTGLWVSLFFWGRIHPLFSILVFTVSTICYGVQAGGSLRSPEVPGAPEALEPPARWITRSGARPLTGFLALLMVFCAFGNVCQDYGMMLGLEPIIQEAALLLGLAGSLTGPVFFGALSDKTGPFRSLMILMGVGLGGLVFIAVSPDFPLVFPLGSLFIQAVIGGIFTLMPQLLLHFYGRPQLSFVLPFLLLFLAALWAAALQFYNGAGALPQDYLLAMAFLLIAAVPLAASAWRRRLAVV